MQVTHDDPLVYLRLFCGQQLNLRSAANKDKLSLMAKELPALWPNLIHIMELENLDFLPQDVSKIIPKLISIRENTFRNSTEREDNDKE